MNSTATSVTTITLNRPERLNALTFEVYTQLATNSARSTRDLASAPS
jgi:enoyl-CoA hydratase/carnithine racemase